MSNRAINAIGFLLGAAAVGIPVGIHLARKLRIPVPAEAYSQPQSVATSIGNLKGARR